MSHTDATTALKIYKTFCKDTEKVVAYLLVAKKLYNVLNVPIPNLKHVRNLDLTRMNSTLTVARRLPYRSSNRSRSTFTIPTLPRTERSTRRASG